MLKLAALSLTLALSGCFGDPDPAAAPTPGSTSAAPTPAATTSAPASQSVPVWYDDAGLHHGDVVEPTAVRLAAVQRGRDYVMPHLALVRTGAIYSDPATDDVWFHPWVGEPRLIGHGSPRSGPGADPTGDLAAWFEGRELVVYDTARSEVISRTGEANTASRRGFVRVDSHQVVWRSTSGLGRRDLDGGDAVLPWHPVAPETRAADPGPLEFIDLGPSSAIWAADLTNDIEGPKLFLADLAEGRTRRIEGLAGLGGLLSPNGSFLLTFGGAITEVGTGETWKPKPFDDRKVGYGWTWAYGDVAVITAWTRGNRLLVSACSATRRVCATLLTQGDVVLPYS
jgi:hypothetical protein